MYAADAFLTLSAVRDPDIARTLLDQREAVRLQPGCISAWSLCSCRISYQYASFSTSNLGTVHQACGNDAQGKTLLLITNSDFNYTDKLMRYSFDPYLPEGFSWRDLFDMVHHDPAWSSPAVSCICMPTPQ